MFMTGALAQEIMSAPSWTVVRNAFSNISPMKINKSMMNPKMIIQDSNFYDKGGQILSRSNRQTNFLEIFGEFQRQHTSDCAVHVY